MHNFCDLRLRTREKPPVCPVPLTVRGNHCLSEALLGSTAAGRVVSGAKQDYPPATRCVWSFELPVDRADRSKTLRELSCCKLSNCNQPPSQPQVIMASYNTVPDLESEAQPLAGAPPRKHGKATLAVVAALAFGAGALAPSAASRVSQMKMFAMACQEGDPDCVDTTQSVDGTGGDNAAVVQNDQTPKNGQGAGGVYIPARM